MVLDITTDTRTRVVLDQATGEFVAKDVNGMELAKGIVGFAPTVKSNVPLVMGVRDGTVENYGNIERVIYRA